MLRKKLGAAAGVAAALTAGFLLAACGSSSVSTGQRYMTMADGQKMLVSGMTTTTHAMKTGSMGGGSSMDMHVSTKVPKVNGQGPIPSQVLATSYWQGMKIQARTMTPIRFVVYDGQRERMVRPSKGTSFHLMIMLNDQYTNEPIPYSTVWATIINGAGKVVYDQRQYPMISAFMGPHYGANVKLPGSGHYKLKLLISPPVAARHIEYAKVWLHPHTVTDSFTWNPKHSEQ